MLAECFLSKDSKMVRFSSAELKGLGWNLDIHFIFHSDTGCSMSDVVLGQQ